MNAGSVCTYENTLHISVDEYNVSTLKMCFCSHLIVVKLTLNLTLHLCRNPSLKQQLFSYAILGFALSEAMGLFCLMVAFLILFAM